MSAENMKLNFSMVIDNKETMKNIKEVERTLDNIFKKSGEQAKELTRKEVEGLKEYQKTLKQIEKERDDGYKKENKNAEEIARLKRSSLDEELRRLKELAIEQENINNSQFKNIENTEAMKLGSEELARIKKKEAEAQENVANEAEKTKTKMESLIDKTQSFHSGVKGVAKVMEELGGTIKEVGSFLTKYVTGPLVGMGVLAGKEVQSFQSARGELAGITGYTGEDLKELEREMEGILENTAYKIDDTAGVVGKYVSVLELQNDELEKASDLTMKVAKITGVSGKEIADDMAKNIRAWGLPVEDLESSLNTILTISQKSGMGLDELFGRVGKHSDVFSQLGFSIEETAGQIGKLYEQGTNVDLLLGSTKQIITSLWRSGIDDVPKAFQEMLREVEKMTDETEAGQLIMEVTGVRTAPEMVKSIMRGDWLGIDEILLDVSANPSDIDEIYNEIQGIEDAWQELKNGILLTFKELEEPIMELIDTIAPLIFEFLEDLKIVIENFNEAPQETKDMIIDFIGTLLILGPVLKMIGGILIFGGKLMPILSKGITLLSEGVGKFIGLLGASNPIVAVLVIVIGLLSLAFREAGGDMEVFGLLLQWLWAQMKRFGYNVRIGISSLLGDSISRVEDFINSVLDGFNALIRARNELLQINEGDGFLKRMGKGLGKVGTFFIPSKEIGPVKLKRPDELRTEKDSLMGDIAGLEKKIIAKMDENIKIRQEKKDTKEKGKAGLGSLFEGIGLDKLNKEIEDSTKGLEGFQKELEGIENELTNGIGITGDKTALNPKDKEILGNLKDKNKNKGEKEREKELQKLQKERERKQKELEKAREREIRDRNKAEEKLQKERIRALKEIEREEKRSKEEEARRQKQIMDDLQGRVNRGIDNIMGKFGLGGSFGLEDYYKRDSAVAILRQAEYQEKGYKLQRDLLESISKRTDNVNFLNKIQDLELAQLRAIEGMSKSQFDKLVAIENQKMADAIVDIKNIIDINVLYDKNADYVGKDVAYQLKQEGAFF